MRNIGVNGLVFIKSFEGFQSHPYQDKSGAWTIGYGHIQGVTADTSAINEAQAEKFLQADVANAELGVLRFIHVPLNDNQYAALVSLTYNAGTAPLEKTLGQLLNAGNYAGAAEEFQKWIYAGDDINNGLIRRRAAEKALFLADPVSGN